MMDKKASDMHVKILTNRIERLDSAEKNAIRKLNLAKRRAEHMQHIKKAKYDEIEFRRNHKLEMRRLLEQKREQVWKPFKILYNLVLEIVIWFNLPIGQLNAEEY